MSEQGKVVINLATGLEDPERVTVALLVGKSAYDSLKGVLRIIARHWQEMTGCLAGSDVVRTRPVFDVRCREERSSFRCISGPKGRLEWHDQRRTGRVRFSQIRRFANSPLRARRSQYA